MSENRRPSFGRRFWRAMIRLLAIVAFFAILGGMAVGGYFGFMELQRSFNAVAARMDANEQTVALIRSDVNDVMAQNLDEQSRQVSNLNEDLANLDQHVANLQEILGNDLSAQQAALELLTNDVTDGNAASADDIAALNLGLTALQGDINENGVHIDEMGGELDGLQTNIDTLDASLVSINTEQEEIMAMGAAFEEVNLPQTLGMFRVWELITRARLRLLENNVGLAMEDIETAVRTIDVLVAATPDSENLKMVQARLALAFASLPDNPATAATDLEAAWDELDIIFSEEIFAGIDIVETVEPDSESSEEATPTP